MPFFNVDTDGLAAKSSQVQGTISRLQAEVNSMQAGLRDLEGIWTGQAASNFQQLVLQWRATQQQVEESLAGINAALSLATRQYADAEQDNARMFLG
ncbi:WXG100 family type VII secretion target [Arthrobacter sp. TmT3-37]|uniref:ESAT-6-like protein n=1 Tax=Arthrobacter agilis TaxID=37921 RepID=A0A2L0UBI1_9MICC|nr:WXG100 family type VII secretion target [Arthrobacter agilis]AUZ86633.1 WXG100 family type VII secretion target [Arthrobacter agilis]